MSARPRVPPAAFNFIATLIAFGAAIGLAWMAWDYYEYAPWTRDGRVRVYTVQVAPEVSVERLVFDMSTAAGDRMASHRAAATAIAIRVPVERGARTAAFKACYACPASMTASCSRSGDTSPTASHSAR